MTHFYKKAVLVLVSFLLTITLSYSNGLSLSGIVIDQAGGTVQFKVTWDNSWRLSAATAPYNWDAAWIFVKFRDCSADPAITQFTNGTVNTTVGNHNWDVLGDGQIFEASKADGTAGIDAATNNTGVMLRRITESTGSVSDTIRLKIDNLPAAGTLDVRVFGIEMVFVQGGAAYPSFKVGDGNGATMSTNSLSLPPGSTFTPLTISSENAIAVNATSNVSSCCSNGSNSTVQAGFPKGWNPFYIMKYEITQGQYADFLNSVGGDMATNALFPGSYNVNRNMINNTGAVPNKYTTTRTDRAAIFLSWDRVSSYLDWACLRPLTEMQYEKAGRGFAVQILNEYAWGSTSATAAAAAGISGAEDGTETITTANANVNATAGGVSWSSGDAGAVKGPLRVGIFATAGTSTRLATGGGYFGVMELTGNTREFYIGICAGDAGGEVCANGISLGDGTLAATGYHDVADWPSGSAPTDGHVVLKGGSWAGANYLSDRNNGNPCVITQNNTIGGRGGR